MARGTVRTVTRDDVPEISIDELVPVPGGGYALRADYEAWRDRIEAEGHLRAVREYDALTKAAELWHPPCRGDARWITDDTMPEERAQLADRCLTECRIRAQCDAYAHRARPLGGLWAGKFYTDPYTEGPA